MDRFRRILVGLDFEDGSGLPTTGSRIAARQALWLAQRTGARVDFLHSVGDGVEEGPAIQEAHRVEARRELESLGGEFGVEPPELVFTEERPWVALSRRVLRGENDLVVVAKRNHGQRDDRKLGSVSMKLVRKCPAPVWVVKPEHELRHRCVIAATDLTPVGDLAVDYGAFIARANESEFCVVHAWQRPMELQLNMARMDAEEKARREAQLTDAARDHVRGQSSLQELGQGVEIYVGCDTPSRAILELAGRKNPDLVVMGTISRGGIAGMLVGNTAEKLLYRLDCSILTVKPEDFICPLAPES